MAKLALVLAFVAAAAAGWLAAGRQGLVDELAQVRDLQQASDGRLLAIERGLAQLHGASAPLEPLSAPGLPPDAARQAGTTASEGGPGLVGRPRAPATMEQRIETLERELATARAAPQGEAAQAGRAPMQMGFNPRGFFGSIEQAEKELKLDAAQKSGIERVIDDVERELETLATRPNEDGKTLKELEQGGPQAEDYMGEEGMAKLQEHMAAMSRFRLSKIPGTNETYAEAQRRIRKDGKARARSFLNAEQGKTWDRSHTDMLFGGGGAMSASIVSFSAPAIEIVAPDGK